MKTTNGLVQFSDLISKESVDNLIRRLEKNFEIFSAEANSRDPKRFKKFWWEQICKHLFAEEWEEDKSKIFKKVMGQTNQFTLEEIKGIFEQAVRWRTNPPALFWKLVRVKRQQIKEQLK
jgi:hypothetical protein